MISTMVARLGCENRKLDGLIMHSALAAMRLAGDPDATTAKAD
jgi:hypothetical protein